MRTTVYTIAAAALFYASPSYAQVTQHDTGITTTSAVAGGVFNPSPGTVAAVASPAVAAAVVAATTTVTTQLAAGALTATTATGATVAIPASVQAAVLAVLSGNVTPAAQQQMVQSLSPEGGGNVAAELVDAMSGLASEPSTGQLAEAVGHFNQLVLAAPPGYLASPPAAFLAVQTVLATMIGAAQAAQ